MVLPRSTSMHLKSSPGTSPTTASESLWFLLQAGVRFFRCASAHQMRARGVEGGGEGGGLTGARVRPLCATHAQRRAAGRLAASRTAGAGARRTPYAPHTHSHACRQAYALCNVG